MTVEHVVTSLVIGLVVLVVTYVALKVVYAIGGVLQRMLVEIFDVRGHLRRRRARGIATRRHLLEDDDG